MFQILQARTDHAELLRRTITDYELKEVILVRVGGVKHVLFISGSEVVHDNFATDKFNIADFERGDKLFVGYDVRIAYPIEDCDKDCQLGILGAIKEACALAELKSKNTADSDDVISLHEMTAGFNGLRFESIPFVYNPLVPELADHSYNAVTTPIGDDYFNAPMGALIPYYADQLLNGKNVVMLGSTGTGKTVLASNVIAEVLKTEPDVSIIRLDYTTLDKLTSPEGKSALNQFLARKTVKGKKAPKVVLLVDEGQRIAKSDQLAPLLEFMEGLTSNAQFSVLAALSQKRHELDAAFVRDGRAHTIIEIDTLGKAKIQGLANYIKGHYDFVLSRDRLDALLTKGSATLAQVWACFTEKSTVSVWRDKLAKYRITPPPTP